jgi:hypothetical protein
MTATAVSAVEVDKHPCKSGDIHSDGMDVPARLTAAGSADFGGVDCE